MPPHEPVADTGAPGPTSPTREQFEQERMTRRAMLRRLGITAGASLFGVVAIDDIARITLAKMREQEALRGLANTVAAEFKNAGVAFAQSSGGHNACGVTYIPCITCPQGTDGNPPPPCTAPYCKNCSVPTDCTDCHAVAYFRYCNCMQSVINNYPLCFDSNGYPLGNCDQVTGPIAQCYGNYTRDLENCDD